MTIKLKDTNQQVAERSGLDTGRCLMKGLLHKYCLHAVFGSFCAADSLIPFDPPLRAAARSSAWSR